MKPITNERAQGMAEYALVILLVAIIVLVIVAVFGTAVGNMFSTIIPMI
ncbi:MAG: Flp family type IVb pilin [Chloroflexota bacterium]